MRVYRIIIRNKLIFGFQFKEYATDKRQRIFDLF